MGLFDSASDKKKKELAALRKAVEASPSPAGFVSVVEKYAAAGDLIAAADTARQAMKQFPTAEKVQQAYQNVRRIELQGQIQDLTRAITEGRAGAGEFDRLAVIYSQELGNKTKAYEIAREGLAKYKKAAGLHLLCGEIRADRYAEDHLANDWIEARNHLEKAVELSPATTMARLHLAQLFVMVGLTAEAKPIVDKLAAEAPSETVEALARQIAAAPAAGPVDVETRLAELQKAKAPGSAGGAPGTAGAVDKNVLEAYLGRMEKIDGFKAAAIVAADGQVLLVKSVKPELSAAFGQLVHAIYLACEESSHRMDIGSFVSGEIDTPRGTIEVAEGGHLVLGILAGEPAKTAQLRKATEEFAAISRPA